MPNQAPYLPRPLHVQEATTEWTWNDGELEQKPDVLLVAAEFTELCAHYEALDRISDAVRLAMEWWDGWQQNSNSFSHLSP